MRNWFWALAAIGLASCSGASSSPPPAADGTGGSCDASGLSAYVGRSYGDALGREMQARSGAKVLRVVRYGEVVTMEYSGDRLTVSLDQQEKVASARCG